MTSLLSGRPSMRSKMILAVLVAGYLVLSVPGWSQAVSGSITGLVTDPSAAAVAGATITVQNVGTRVATQVTTTDTGYYSVPNLIPGTYSVVTEAQGFKTFRVDQVTVNLNSI